MIERYDEDKQNNTKTQMCLLQNKLDRHSQALKNFDQEVEKTELWLRSIHRLRTTAQQNLSLSLIERFITKNFRIETASVSTQNSWLEILFNEIMSLNLDVAQGECIIFALKDISAEKLAPFHSWLATKKSMLIASQQKQIPSNIIPSSDEVKNQRIEIATDTNSQISVSDGDEHAFPYFGEVRTLTQWLKEKRASLTGHSLTAPVLEELRTMQCTMAAKLAKKELFSSDLVCFVDKLNTMHQSLASDPQMVFSFMHLILQWPTANPLPKRDLEEECILFYAALISEYFLLVPSKTLFTKLLLASLVSSSHVCVPKFTGTDAIASTSSGNTYHLGLMAATLNRIIDCGDSKNSRFLVTDITSISFSNWAWLMRASEQLHFLISDSQQQQPKKVASSAIDEIISSIQYVLIMAGANLWRRYQGDFSSLMSGIKSMLTNVNKLTPKSACRDRLMKWIEEAETRGWIPSKYFKDVDPYIIRCTSLARYISICACSLPTFLICIETHKHLHIHNPIFLM